MKFALYINSTYQLAPLPLEQRTPGTIYINCSRTWELLEIYNDATVLVRCKEIGRSVIVGIERLRNY